MPDEVNNFGDSLVLDDDITRNPRISLRSKRSRTKRTKFGQRVLVFRIRDARKMGRDHLFALAPFFARPE